MEGQRILEGTQLVTFGLELACGTAGGQTLL